MPYGSSDDPFADEPQSDHEILRAVYREVKRTNGRVGVLEAWRSQMETEAARKAAFREGASTALVTKAQWRLVAGIVAGVGTVAGGISAGVTLLVRFA